MLYKGSLPLARIWLFYAFPVDPWILNLGFVLPHFGKSKGAHKEFENFNENRLLDKSFKFQI